MQLYPYQQAGVEFLAGRKTALLADEPGLGKTVQAIRACDKAMALRVLVICPAGVVENWKREIAMFREGDWTAYVTSFDKARGGDHHRIIAQWWDVCIIDEGHFLKEIAAKRTRAVYGKQATMDKSALAAKAGQVWVLTGTPMPNNAGELYSHLRALYPEAVTSERTGVPWTYYQFSAAYCQTRSNGFGNQIVGTKNEAALHQKLQGFMLRRRKAEVLTDLPPLTFGELFLEGDVAGLDFAEVEIVKKVLAEEGVDGLRKVSLNGSISTLRRLVGMAKVVPAAQWINDWLDSTPKDKKIVVFCHHKSVIDELFNKLHLRAVRVDGSMKQGERQASVDRLQNDPDVRVFLGNIAAAGTGITLTKASDLLFVESSFVPADMQQAAMRIHRISQTEPCLVRFATIAGSIDEQIQRALMRKVQSITRVVDGVEHETDRGIFA